MAHWRLVSPRAGAGRAEAGGELYVWTVDDAARIRALEAMGVTGVITNDPAPVRLTHLAVGRRRDEVTRWP